MKYSFLSNNMGTLGKRYSIKAIVSRAYSHMIIS